MKDSAPPSGSTSGGGWLRWAARGALLAALVAVVTSPVEAQVVRGVVVSVGEGVPIPDARLVLRNQNDAVVAAAVSGPDGAFELRLRSGGQVSLEVSHLGFADWNTAPFALGRDAVIEVEVKLGVEAIPLDPITVLAESTMGLGPLAGFNERMSNPALDGYFLEEEEIARRPMAKPTDLVLAAPGMTVGLASAAVGLDRGVIMAGGCPARTFIDGVRVHQGAGASIDDLLTPDRIAAVEVYPRAAGAPVEYSDNSARGCGLVLFWTKPAEGNGDGGMGMGRILVGVGLLLGILSLALFG